MATAADRAHADFDVCQWQCRVCSYERYHRVIMSRGNNANYHTQFFARSRCSVMFLLPANVNALNAALVVDVRTVTEFRVKAGR
jgi:hypothetical protein